MADRADRRRIASEELLLMAVQTRFMLRIIRNVGKSIITRPNFSPIGRWKFVTRLTVHLMRLHRVIEL